MKQKFIVFVMLAFAIVQGLASETVLLYGDVNRDGLVSITDASEVIDAIIGGNYNMDADVDGDGKVSVTDLSELIDIILEISSFKLCTFLVITKNDGTTGEYLIDDDTKVSIIQPNLTIQTDGQALTYPLAQLKQLCYVERKVALSKSSVTEFLIEPESQTINTQQP